MLSNHEMKCDSVINTQKKYLKEMIQYKKMFDCKKKNIRQ